MNDENKGEENKEVIPPVTEEKKDDSSSQSPIKKKLGEVKRTEKEKLLFSKKRIETRLAEIGKEDGDIDSPIPDEEEDDNKPLTVGDLKKFQKKEAQKTAIQLAEAIEDEDERELTKHYLQTRIVPSGNPTDDLRDAQAIVNSVKSTQIAEIAQAKRKPKGQGSGGGAPAKVEDRFEPTQEELQIASFAGKKDEKSVKEFILKARKNLEAAQVS